MKLQNLILISLQDIPLPQLNVEGCRSNPPMQIILEEKNEGIKENPNNHENIGQIMLMEVEIK